MTVRGLGYKLQPLSDVGRPGPRSDRSASARPPGPDHADVRARRARSCRCSWSIDDRGPDPPQPARTSASSSSSSGPQVNVGLVADKVGRPDVDPQTLFGSLATVGQAVGADPRHRGSDAYVPISVDTRYGATVGARRADRAGARRTGRTDDHALLAQRARCCWPSACPIPGSDGAYFEVNHAQRHRAEPELSLRLPLVAAVAIDRGDRAPALGWYGQPSGCCARCADISEVAADISLGQPRRPPRLRRVGRRPRPRPARRVVQRHGVGAPGPDRPRRPVRVRRQPRAALAPHHVQRPARGAAQRPRRDARAGPARARPPRRPTSSASPSSSRTCSRSPASTPAPCASRSTTSPSSRRCAWRCAPCRSTPIPVEADPVARGPHRLMRQAPARPHLANYIDNAAKYAGGATAVLVERVAWSPTTPTASPARSPTTSSTTIRITVEDRGPGVARGRPRAHLRPLQPRRAGRQPRHRPRRRASASPSSAEHARLQGGAVWVEHRTDGQSGARFVLELPHRRAGRARTTRTARSPSTRSRSGQHMAISHRERRVPVTLDRRRPSRRTALASPRRRSPRCCVASCGIPLDDQPRAMSTGGAGRAAEQTPTSGGDTTAYVYFVQDDRLVDVDPRRAEPQRRGGPERRCSAARPRPRPPTA